MLSNLEPRFLLAHLYIRLLCDQLNVRNVRRALDKAPANLFAFYDVAMARIADQPEPRRQAVKTALCYLFCAKRPLNTEELLHALGVEIDDAGLDETATPDLPFVLSDSVGLIRADAQTGIVGLVHHTLHEYLKSRPGQLLPWPEREVAKVCLIHLNFDEFQSGPCGDAKDLEERLQKYRSLTTHLITGGPIVVTARPARLNTRISFNASSGRRGSCPLFRSCTCPVIGQKGGTIAFPDESRLCTPLPTGV